MNVEHENLTLRYIVHISGEQESDAFIGVWPEEACRENVVRGALCWKLKKKSPIIAHIKARSDLKPWDLIKSKMFVRSCLPCPLLSPAIVKLWTIH